MVRDAFQQLLFCAGTKGSLVKRWTHFTTLRSVKPLHLKTRKNVAQPNNLDQSVKYFEASLSACRLDAA